MSRPRLTCRIFFARGVALSPWAPDDQRRGRCPCGGDQPVRIATPGGLLSVELRSTLARKRNDTRLFRWSGNGWLPIAGPNADLFAASSTTPLRCASTGRVDALGSGPVPGSRSKNTVLDLATELASSAACRQAVFRSRSRCAASPMPAPTCQRHQSALRIEGLGRPRAGGSIGRRVEAVGENLACPPAARTDQMG